MQERAARRGGTAVESWQGGEGGALRRVLPAWLASRACVLVATLAAAAPVPGTLGERALSPWDGRWYADIARLGYSFAHEHPGSPLAQTPYPFFPLLPLALRSGSQLGLPPWLVGAILSHAALLVGLCGLYVLVTRHFGQPAAQRAVWSLAFFPGAAPLSMVYPEAAMLAFATWTFVLAEEGRVLPAGWLAACAALVRPNGAAVAIAAASGLALARRLPAALAMTAPTVVAILGWMLFLHGRTGDPLAFLHAKAAWSEISLGGIVAGRDPFPKLDLAAFVFAAAVLLVAAPRLPLAWLLFAALWLLPSLLLGILGMPRYVSVCFPVFAAAGLLLGRAPASARLGILAVSAAGLLLLAVRISSLRMMP